MCPLVIHDVIAYESIACKEKEQKEETKKNTIFIYAQKTDILKNGKE